MRKQRKIEQGKSTNEKQILRNTIVLQQVAAKKYENQQALGKQERLEQDVFELNGQSRKLFERLLYTWHLDRELGSWLEQEHLEIQHHERQIVDRLENQKEELLLEKRQLRDLEDDLYNQRQLLARVEKEGEK